MSAPGEGGTARGKAGKHRFGLGILLGALLGMACSGVLILCLAGYSSRQREAALQGEDPASSTMEAISQENVNE